VPASAFLETAHQLHLTCGLEIVADKTLVGIVSCAFSNKRTYKHGFIMIEENKATTSHVTNLVHPAVLSRFCLWLPWDFCCFTLPLQVSTYIMLENRPHHLCLLSSHFCAMSSSSVSLSCVGKLNRKISWCCNIARVSILSIQCAWNSPPFIESEGAGWVLKCPPLTLVSVITSHLNQNLPHGLLISNQLHGAEFLRSW
jgi:hypothetical protein